MKESRSWPSGFERGEGVEGFVLVGACGFVVADGDGGFGEGEAAGGFGGEWSFEVEGGGVG